MKNILVLLLMLCIGYANAQKGKEKAKKTSSLRLVSTAKIGGFDYQVFVKNIKEDVAEARVRQEDPNSPKVVTDLKNLMDYDNDETGEEYILYRINSKGKKVMALTFPKQIKNRENKISTEGSYLINSRNLTIIFKKFDYHFPSEMTTLYNVNKYGNVSFVKRTEKELNTDSFGDAYIKKAEEKSIKSN